VKPHGQSSSESHDGNFILCTTEIRLLRRDGLFEITDRGSRVSMIVLKELLVVEVWILWREARLTSPARRIFTTAFGL
jgi:hypothetical protein